MRASLASLAMGAITTAAAAQETRPDSIRPVPLSAIVISAERSATPMNRTTAAVSRLTADDIERLPQATLADVLRHVPGVAVVDFDGLGKDPQLMVRGFYGGGESEYVVVMVDGLVVNRVHNGTLAWDALPPPAAIASIEVMRGSGSTVAGDAAVAAVVSIRTRPAAERRVAWNVSGGGFGSFDAALDLGGSLAGRGMRLDASADRTEGFRAHAAREGRRLAASVEMTPAWQLSVNAATRRFDEPGPLLESALATNRSASDPMFRFDETEDAELTVGVRHQRSLGSGQVSATATLDRRNATILRTLPLAPGFGDTKERALGTRRAALELQADFGDSGLPGDDHLTIGGRLDVGDLASRYYEVVADRGERGSLDAAGDAARGTASLFAHAAIAATDWLRWTLGARADWISDSFHAGDGTLDQGGSHAAFSPRAGVNVRYASGSRSTGHAFLAVSGTFKAPTLDQLFDQRSIPVPFPPFSISTSNPGLDPQRGRAVEAGLYHQVVGATTRLAATLTVYETAMRNELDFDVQAFRYVNIGRSRHRGVEGAVDFSVPNASLFGQVTVQDVVARAGDNAGRQLKAVPGQVVTAGFTLSPARLGVVTVSATRMADMFLDDANTRRIPSWTRIDAQVSRRLGEVAIIAGARNLLDARYSSTGFPDPSGSGEAFFHPAAGRVLTLGIRHGR